eukprot:6019507-Pleurochrysis_carterae.AAC.3
MERACASHAGEDNVIGREREKGRRERGESPARHAGKKWKDIRTLACIDRLHPLDRVPELSRTLQRADVQCADLQCQNMAFYLAETKVKDLKSDRAAHAARMIPGPVKPEA